jgi:hypothetical protein
LAAGWCSLAVHAPWEIPKWTTTGAMKSIV